MKKFWKLLIAFVLGLGLFCGVAYWKDFLIPAFSRDIPVWHKAAFRASTDFAKVRRDKAQLRAFLREMPLNTDDAGVFGTDITEEFARAVESHPDLSWEDLKQMARASLEHAFVSDPIKAKLITSWETQMREFEASRSVETSL